MTSAVQEHRTQLAWGGCVTWIDGVNDDVGQGASGAAEVVDMTVEVAEAIVR